MTTTREAALEAALLKTRRLVCEAAEVGFNYADGDWADRLYRNNGNIAAALSTPAADTRVVAVELLDRAMKTTMSGIVRAEIRAIIDTATPAQHDALAAANTRADQARDSALEDVAKEAHAFAAENQWHPSSVTNLVTRIIALRDKPATAVTVHEAARVLLTYLSETQDSVVWETTEDAMAVPMADPGDVIFSALRAIAGGGDE